MSGLYAYTQKLTLDLFFGNNQFKTTFRACFTGVFETLSDLFFISIMLFTPNFLLIFIPSIIIILYPTTDLSINEENYSIQNGIYVGLVENASSHMFPWLATFISMSILIALLMAILLCAGGL